MNVIERLETGEFAIARTQWCLEEGVPVEEGATEQLLHLAKLGQAALEGTSTFCDWQTYDGKDACVHCPAQTVCKLRKEQTP